MSCREMGMVRLVWMVSLVLGVAVSVSAGQVIFRVNDPVGRNVVRFESKAPLETIVGTTGRIVGTVRVDLEDISASPQVVFEVDAGGLNTGIELRNHHMWTRYLEIALYPRIRFELEQISQVSRKNLVDGRAVELLAIGTVSLHGVARKVKVQVKSAYLKEGADTRQKLPGNLLRVEAEFAIKLGDFNIPIPQLVALKLDETIRVFVDVLATDVAPEAQD